MMRGRDRLMLLVPALMVAAPLSAAALTIVKSIEVVTDGVSALNPKALPGSGVNYAMLVTNPLANLTAAVGSVTISDTIPVQSKLRVTDFGTAGSGPVEFTDGNLLGLGLLGSNLSFRYTTLASTTDSVEFNDGQGWTYVPVPDAQGYDAAVRAVRVTLTGSHRANSSFRLRYRVIVR